MKNLKSFAFAAVVPALFSASAHATIDRSLARTFSVQPTGEIQVENVGGNISVEPSATGSVTVTALEKFQASSESAADGIAQKLSVTIEQHGAVVTASAKYNDPGSWFHFGSWPPVEVDFVVTVPKGFDATLKTSGGNVDIGDLEGHIHAKTSGGSLELGRLGGGVDASTSGGNISLRECRSSVNLQTSGGEIKVGRIAGSAVLSTSGGDIVVESVEGLLRADTSGGSVRARIDGALTGDCDLETSGGGVKVTVDKSVGYFLDASTSGGDVQADGIVIDVSDGAAGSSRLAGKVNGGGPRLTLRSSGGGIEVRNN
jgi:DUF4097 and DUF4098 domain-containing protein YvlB